MGKVDHTKKETAIENEASKLLEAALLQMDGIISGNTGSLSAHSPTSGGGPGGDYGFSTSPVGIREAAANLAASIQAYTQQAPLPDPEPNVVKALLQWLSPAGDLEERCRKLHSERDNLQLQVQVLSEQIEAQCDKIVDLEKRLGDKKQALSNTEDILQRETLSRSSLETQKLELLSQISELKLHQASIERENLELRCHYNNNNNSSSSSANNDHHHHGNARKQLPAYLHRMSPQPTTVATSTPVHQNQGVAIRTSPSPSPVNITNMASPSRILDASPKTPPATYKRHIELHYSSLPRQQYLSNGGSLTLVNSASLQQQQHCSGQGQLGGALQQQQQRGGFAETEKVIIDDNSSTLPVTDMNDIQQQSFNNNNNKNKGMKKIFGKMKRSGSGNLEDLPPGLGVGEFQRGGVRATASPRLGWSEPQTTKKYH